LLPLSARGASHERFYKNESGVLVRISDWGKTHSYLPM
jgi:hypothetical protein